jgi:hypothetical protein
LDVEAQSLHRITCCVQDAHVEVSNGRRSSPVTDLVTNLTGPVWRNPAPQRLYAARPVLASQRRQTTIMGMLSTSQILPALRVLAPADTVKERAAQEAYYRSGNCPWMLWTNIRQDRDPLQSAIAGLAGGAAGLGPAEHER